jgi:hypothetical protein
MASMLGYNTQFCCFYFYLSLDKTLHNEHGLKPRLLAIIYSAKASDMKVVLIPSRLIAYFKKI